MENLFIILMMVSLVCFLLSWLIPNTFSPLFKNKLSKWKIRLVFGLATIVFFVMFGVVSDSNSQAQLNVSEKSEKQKIETTSQDKLVAENNPVEQPKQLTTSDKLWIALDQSMKKREGYDIKYDEAKKDANITYVSTSFWDESSLVRGAYTTLVKYGMEAFKIDNVDSVTINYKTEFTDSYGKKSMEDAIILTMFKEEFLKYDWEGLKYQSIYKQMEKSCSEYYIHPAVLKNLKYDDLFLTL